MRLVVQHLGRKAAHLIGGDIGRIAGDEVEKTFHRVTPVALQEGGALCQIKVIGIHLCHFKRRRRQVCSNPGGIGPIGKTGKQDAAGSGAQIQYLVKRQSERFGDKTFGFRARVESIFGDAKAAPSEQAVTDDL